MMAGYTGSGLDSSGLFAPALPHSSDNSWFLDAKTKVRMRRPKSGCEVQSQDAKSKVRMRKIE
jgi:hypothetical protein